MGSIQRFESSVSISGLQVALEERDVVSEVLFCRRAVRIQDMLKTMNKVVVSDSVSMRGVDKKIVIIIPSPRNDDHQKEVECEKKLREQQAAEKAAKPPPSLPDDSGFQKPTRINQEDEVVLYRRKPLPGDKPDGADEAMDTGEPAPGKRQTEEKKAGGDADDGDSDNIDEDDGEGDDYVLSNLKPHMDILQRPSRFRYNPAAHQSLMRRAINTLDRSDKDMILDLFTDAPRHAVIFHFAEDDYQYEPDLEWGPGAEKRPGNICSES